MSIIYNVHIGHHLVSGLPLVHGHVHRNQKFEYPNHLHVGVDDWEGQLAPQELVLEWLVPEKEKTK